VAWSTDRAANADALVASADAAMYVRKRAGRAAAVPRVPRE
jgi:PleD family two-component response regulator